MAAILRRASVSAHMVSTEMVTVRGRITSGTLMMRMVVMSVVAVVMVTHCAA